MKALVSWSGGKDSCYAMHVAVANGYQPVLLLNMMNENGAISRSHGLIQEVLVAQAASLGLPIITVPSSWSDYETNFIATLQKAKTDYNIEAVIFGDIDLQEHRDWEEKVCAAAGLQAVLPLWQQDRTALVYEMINKGISAHITSCNANMGINYLGRKIDEALVLELIEQGIDACGENGEYHTVVTNCPLMKTALLLTVDRKQIHENYCFATMELVK